MNIQTRTNIYINNNNTGESPNFKGFWASRARTLGKNPALLSEKGAKIGHAIGERSSDIITLLANAPSTRVSFMDSLVASYKIGNKGLSPNLREDSKPLLNIYNMITKPQTEHFNIVSKSQMPFKTLETVFEKAEDRQGLRFVQTIQHDVLDGSEKSADHIVEMLKSPNRETYLKTPQDFKSYLILNAENENAVKDLDKLIEEGRYDRKTYDIKLEISNMMKNKKIQPVINGYADFIESRYTPERVTFLNKMCNEYLPHRSKLSFDENTDILLMYSTTTKQNLQTRLEILNKFKNSAGKAESQKDEICSMRELFERMDTNKHVHGFINKALGDNIKVENIKELNKIVSIVPPKKAEIFHKNISRIVERTTPFEREQVLLNEIENPLYQSPRPEVRNRLYIRAPKRDNIFKRFAKIVENKLNKRRYEKLESEIEAPKAKFIDINPKPLKMVASIDIPKFEEVITTPVSTSGDINLVRTVKQSKEARRLKVKADINNIIKTKLGNKTLERQQTGYNEKATAIRLSVLPEIFDSISATRKAQRSAGKTPSINNRDALKLYEKVQGKNKKLVRYMLKQTDANNNRIFNIKDITKLIDETEKQIALEKKLNPEFRAKDAKSYYDNIYNSMVEKYGNPKRTKKI